MVFNTETQFSENDSVASKMLPPYFEMLTRNCPCTIIVPFQNVLSTGTFQPSVPIAGNNVSMVRVAEDTFSIMQTRVCPRRVRS